MNFKKYYRNTCGRTSIRKIRFYDNNVTARRYMSRQGEFRRSNLRLLLDIAQHIHEIRLDTYRFFQGKLLDLVLSNYYIILYSKDVTTWIFLFSAQYELYQITKSGCNPYNTEHCSTISAMLLRAVWEDFFIQKIHQSFSLTIIPINVLFCILLQVRDKEEIRSIFENIGFEFPENSFDTLWQEGMRKDCTGGVCVETFRELLAASDLVAKKITCA